MYQTLVGKPEIKSQLGHSSVHDGKAIIIIIIIIINNIR